MVDNVEGQALTDFSTALYALKAGKRVRRASWESSAVLIKAGGYTVDSARAGSDYEKVFKESPFTIAPHIDVLFVETGMAYPGWIPTQEDLFANDWEIL